MTQPTGQQPVPHAALRRRRRLWITAGILIALCILVPLVYLQTVPRRAATPRAPQREQLTRLSSLLQQYAQQNDNTLPEQVPVDAQRQDESLLIDPTTNRPIDYRVVTESGERLRYEPYGDRVVAWTEPDERGRRWVLFNNLEEVASVLDEDLDQREQQIRSMGALNRVRGVKSPDDAAAADDGEPDEADSPGTSPG